MKRVALVIGNADYPDNPLANPCHDAHDMADVLRQFEFDVLEYRDVTHESMHRALQEFRSELHLAEVGLFFFAGHGLQIDGKNYLLATDTSTDDQIAVRFTSLELDHVIASMEHAETRTNLIILDACRNNPWERRWHRSSGTQGLASVYVPRGTLIAFATSPGQTAADGVGQRNGKYTSALLKHIGTPDCTIEAMFKRVRNTLNVTTNGKQISWEHTSLASEFFFNRSVSARIDLYSEKALKDGSVELKDSYPSHRIIRSLKVLTWNVQNAAVQELVPEAMKGFGKNSLFIIGRNLYQAACGNSNAALSFIEEFPTKTRGLVEAKRRALLDGMLFELFFDPDGQLREEFKDRRFNELFGLQRYASTAASFDFIAECLHPYSHLFHTLPGKLGDVAIDIVLEAGDDPNNPYVDRICLASLNLLRPENEVGHDEDDEPDSYRSYTRPAFENRISKQLLIPLHLLSFTYTGVSRTPSNVRSPLEWTVRKRAV